MTIMNTNYSRIFLLIFLWIFYSSSVVNAQRNNNSDVSLSFGGGVMYYNGDLSDSDPIPDGKLINPFVTADISWLLIDRLELALGLYYGKTRCNASNRCDFTSFVDF